ncbi:uncharacterized protein LOC129274703 [Lytechinus pictus]|uniref:uncharacterized protein LOC129274703 n=1 Tax=Lytechinus pictus TaxID=7653 RepID=UPI0030B9FD41
MAHVYFVTAVIVTAFTAIGGTRLHSTFKTAECQSCRYLRLEDGVLIQGTIVNASSVFKRNQERTATTSIVYCAPAKDPCLSNPCSQGKEGYAHPYNQGYDCDCAFGYYGDECQQNGKIGGIVDNEGKLLLFKMPTFELEHEIQIAPPDPMKVQYKFYAVYDRLNDLVYVAANDVFYRGRPSASGHFERFNDFTEMYPGQGRSILLDNSSTWLYLGNSESGLITRYQLPDMLQEETIYHEIHNTRRTPEDTPIYPGPFVLAISHIQRLLFWMDSKGIMSCTVDDCMNTAGRIHLFSEEKLPKGVARCHLVVDDKNPCLSNPCSQGKEGYAHPYNQGYDCDCAFGYYGDECQQNGKIGGIVDNEGKLLLFKMPTFELEHEIQIAPPDPMKVQYKFYAERSILLDNSSTWLYLGNSESGLITRYQLPDMLQEETIYHEIHNTRRTPEDTPIYPGPFVLAISHIQRLLFWMDSKGIMSCTVDDCMNTAGRIHLFSEEKLPKGVARCHLVVDDKIGKIFWSDYLSTEDGYPHDILMANLDGKRVQTVWKGTSKFKLMVFTIWNDWLVAYELESFRFWMSRFRSHIAESSKETALPWKWFQSTFQGKHYITEMVSV